MRGFAKIIAPQQIRQQVQFSASTIPTAQQYSSKGKSSSKGKEKSKPKPKAADWSVVETKQLTERRTHSDLERDLQELQEQLGWK